MTGRRRKRGTAMSKIKAKFFFPQNQINLFLLGVQIPIIFIFALLLVFIVVAGSEVRKRKIMYKLLLLVLTN